MPKVIAITGLMRSGTSMVAEVVHRLGWQAAPIMACPLPPSWRFDWEEPHLTKRLMLRQPINWKTYIERRLALAERLGFHGIAIKSPYLALRWAEFMLHAPADVFVIKTERTEFNVERSLEAHPQLSKDDQEEIRAALHGVKADFGVSYESWAYSPYDEVPVLGMELGATEEGWLAAAALVGRPTEYEPCPQ